MTVVELSFVIPAFNEEVFIEDTLGALDSLSKNKVFNYEVVVVDDGSQDDTFLRAYRYSQKNGHVKVVRYPINAGKGHAIKTGFMKASGDIIVFVDSDLEIDLKTISRYVEALEDADIVIATKWHNESEVSMSLARRLLSRTFNVLARMLIGFDLKDTQVGLKVMRRGAVSNIFPKLAVKRYAFDVELLAVSHLHKLRIVEMPVKVRLDAPFKPKEAWRMFIDLLGIAYRLRITRWYQRQSVSGIL